MCFQALALWPLGTRVWTSFAGEAAAPWKERARGQGLLSATFLQAQRDLTGARWLLGMPTGGAEPGIGRAQPWGWGALYFLLPRRRVSGGSLPTPHQPGLWQLWVMLFSLLWPFHLPVSPLLSVLWLPDTNLISVLTRVQ